MKFNEWFLKEIADDGGYNKPVYESAKWAWEYQQAKIDKALEEMEHQLGDEDYEDMERPEYDAMLYALRNIKEILKEGRDD